MTDGSASKGLDVTGGVGGVGAALDDLAAAASRLVETAADVGDVATVLLRANMNADLVVAALSFPGEAFRAAVGFAELAGPTGLPVDAAALLALAASVRSAVVAYEAGEGAVATLVESAQDAAVFAVSRQPVALTAVVAANRAGVDVAGAADQLLFAAPWLADLAGGVEGVVAGPAAPLDYEDGLGLLVSAGAARGWLSEAGAHVDVTAVPSSNRSGRIEPPTSIAGLVATQADLDAADGRPDRVRVVQVPQADGSSAWVVVVPGTQEWSPTAGANPSDLTSDVLLMARTETLLAAGVERALVTAQEQAGREGLGDPVLLAGHSQGGIVAGALAADPGFRRRQRVTHVVTSGAPIARMPIPSDVSVLSLEHRQDAVPRLEGERNADRRSWVTVTRDLRGSGATTASASHAASRYRETAALADASRSTSVRAWRAGSSAFFAGDAHGTPVVRDFVVERDGAGRAGPAPRNEVGHLRTHGEEFGRRRVGPAP